MLDEFGIDTSTSMKVSNNVGIETFLEVVETPSVLGKWYCSVDLDTINKKMIERIEKYVKFSSNRP